jgi:hypothetical protein
MEHKENKMSRRHAERRHVTRVFVAGPPARAPSRRQGETEI